MHQKDIGHYVCENEEREKMLTSTIKTWIMKMIVMLMVEIKGTIMMIMKMVMTFMIRMEMMKTKQMENEKDAEDDGCECEKDSIC